MGGTSYSSERSHVSRVSLNTHSNSIDQNFKQNVERKAHKEMKSQGVSLREARDSVVHPNTFPVIIALDLTGSMQEIPQNLIKTGLPTIVSESIQGGVQSPAILFLGVGDHETDREPLQIGQFESGDVELDLWLGRTYLEGGGGSNMGESYGLAHFFAARHTITDHWVKRGQKGLLITIGDEPSLKSYPTRALKEIMGNQQVEGFTQAEILAEVQEKWDVYHINPRDNDRYRWRDAGPGWKALLGQGYIGLDDYEKIPKTITNLIIDHGTRAAESGHVTLGEIGDTPMEDQVPSTGEKPNFL
jgi:hypothetical protein